MVTQGKPLRGGIYGRLSLAIMGDTTKVDDQVAIGRRILASLPQQVIIDDRHVFKDNSKSAWQRKRKRPDWDRMIACIQAGELDILAVYHGDRLIRQPHDLEQLLTVADQQGIRLIAPTGQYNLDDPDHRMMLRWMAARACNESDNLSRRQKEGHRRRREQGRVRSGGRGGRPYGWETDGITHRQDEIKRINECADRLLSGEGAGEIARDWNAQDLRTVTGALWAHGTIKKMMLRPRLAGLMPDGKSRAAWKPALDPDPKVARERWEAVTAVLSNKAAGFPYATNARTHLLAGIAECGPCKVPVAIRHHARGKQLIGYGCINPKCKQKVHRAQLYVDGWVIGHVLELLSDEHFIAELRAPADAGLAGRINELEARRAKAAQQLEKLVDNPHVEPELLAASLAGFDKRIDELRNRIALSARRRLLIEHAGLTEAEWEELPLSTRRALVRACYRVVIWRSTKKGPGFDSSTIELIRVSD